MSAEVFDDTACSLGEGCLWHPLRQTLFWFDIDNKVLFEKAIGGKRKEYRFDRTVSAAGIVDDSNLINDGRADRRGGFWIGTMGCNAEPTAGVPDRFD